MRGTPGGRSAADPQEQRERKRQRDEAADDHRAADAEPVGERAGQGRPRGQGDVDQRRDRPRRRAGESELVAQVRRQPRGDPVRAEQPEEEAGAPKVQVHALAETERLAHGVRRGEWEDTRGEHRGAE